MEQPTPAITYRSELTFCKNSHVVVSPDIVVTRLPVVVSTL